MSNGSGSNPSDFAAHAGISCMESKQRLVRVEAQAGEFVVKNHVGLTPQRSPFGNARFGVALLLLGIGTTDAND